MYKIWYLKRLDNIHTDDWCLHVIDLRTVSHNLKIAVSLIPVMEDLSSNSDTFCDHEFLCDEKQINPAWLKKSVD